MKTVNLTIEEVELLRERLEAEVIEGEKYLSNIKGMIAKLGGPVDKNSIKQKDQGPKRRGRKPKNELNQSVKRGNRRRKPKSEKIDVTAEAVAKETKKNIFNKTIKKEVPTKMDKKKQLQPQKPVPAPKKAATKPIKSKMTGAKQSPPKNQKSKIISVKKATTPIESKAPEPQGQVIE